MGPNTFISGVLSSILLLTGVQAQIAEERAARHFAALRQNPQMLLPFLRDMPKGGDLHIHLSGAIYAESWIDFAAQDNLCVDRTASILLPPPCDVSCARYTSKPAVSCAYADHVFYNQLIDAWSMRNWNRGEDSGHDHFFATFDKFQLAAINSVGSQLAEVASRAAADHVEYVELMHTADNARSAELGAKLGWADDLSRMREKLLEGGLKDVISTVRQDLDRDETRRRQILRCGTPDAESGCGVTIHYLYQVLRGMSPAGVFAQILLGFELVQADSRFVGLNLVMPEDWYIPMRDFKLHMKMLDYLHSVYPTVHISLHAGELAMGLVPPEGLRFHIRESLERGHAERIGHGVSVMNEDDSAGLLKEMTARKVLVEICLSSNDVILGVDGDNHPLPTYLSHNVPVALATDDQGVARSDMTHEYLRAVETYKLSYAQLKRMARQSLEHSFLSGASLWRGDFQMVSVCAGKRMKNGTVSSACQKFLDGSERASMQWQLEMEFAKFEAKY